MKESKKERAGWELPEDEHEEVPLERRKSSTINN
jgi:hypothetical protein